MTLREQEVSARLVTFGRPALDALIPKLVDPDVRVVDTAAYAIGRFGVNARPAIPALRAALRRRCGWAAHALAATGAPEAVAALEEVAVAGDSTSGAPVLTGPGVQGALAEALAKTQGPKGFGATAGALVLMGPAGQRALAEALVKMKEPERFSWGVDLFLPSARVDVSELVKRLIALASDESRSPASRGVACTFLLQTGGAAVSALPLFRRLALDEHEVIQRRCGTARNFFEKDMEHAHRPAADGPPVGVVSGPIERSRGNGVPSAQGIQVEAWQARVKRRLEGNYFAARIGSIDSNVMAQRVKRVAAIGVTEGGYLMLGKSLDWSDGPGQGPFRTTAEIYYRFSDEQHVDTVVVPWTNQKVVSDLGAIAGDTFGNLDVEALTFVAGIAYDDDFLPLMIVHIPREAAARFRWAWIDPEILRQRLPPEDVGISTFRFKSVWESDCHPAHSFDE